MNALQRCPVCAAWASDLVGHMCKHAPDALVTTILAIIRPPMTITTNISPTPAPAESSLVALDAAEAVVLSRARKLSDAFDTEAIRQPSEFWWLLGMLRAAVENYDLIEGRP